MIASAALAPKDCFAALAVTQCISLNGYLGPVSKACRAMDAHARGRLRQWLCGKHQQGGPGTRRYPDQYLHGDLGLTHLALRTRNLPWAKA